MRRTAPTRYSAIRFWLRLSWLVLLSGVALALPATAWAAQPVTVYSTSAELEPLVGRLCAELATAGYAVARQLSAPPSRCERGDVTHATSPWVGVAMSSVDRDVVVAAICFGGTAVTVGGPKAEPVRFVVSIAEALNGLRATPAADSRPRRRARPAEASPSPSPARLRHTATVSQSLLVDPGGFPVLWGAALDVQLGLTPHWALAIGGFLPIVRAELSTPHAELRTGLTFLRLGPALRYSLGPFALSGSLAVGPAFTWVTAHAVAPYVAQPAFASGVLSSAGLALLYPSRGRVFALAGGRASLLLPAPRISALDQQRHDLGPLLLETSLGIGLRL